MGKVIALCPAHNEADGIGEAITSLLSQTIPPDKIIVVSDNSTDATVSIAESFGPLVSIIETVGNTHKKSGALNQALDRLRVPDDDYVLIVDADTMIAETWIEDALKEFADEAVGAVGGIFLGDGKNGLLGDAQGLEYARYRRQIRRDHGKARVLTGTSTMVRMATFRKVRDLREDGRLPGGNCKADDCEKRAVRNRENNNAARRDKHASRKSQEGDDTSSSVGMYYNVNALTEDF